MNPPVSKSRRPLIAGLLIIVLAVIGYAVWNHLRSAHGHAHASGDAHAHAHGDHGAAVLALNHDQRWATDAPLRLGMQRIRDAVAPAGAGLNQEQANVLANAVQENVGYLIQNCQLEPAADANLHLLITEMVEGSAMVAANPSSKEGLMKLTHALAEYPVYFDHPDWHPLAEPKS